MAIDNLQVPPKRLLSIFLYGFLAALSPLFCRGAETTLPEPYFPGPVFIQLKTEDFSIESIDKIYDLGFRGFRRGIYWETVDKGDGTYDFSEWDKEFAHANKKGMRIVGCLFCDNKNYEDDGVGGIQTEAGRKGFAKFAAAAEQYKDYDILWEIWNEPNVRTFWRKNKERVGNIPPAEHNSEVFAEEYTALVKEMASEVLKKVFGAFIMAGSVSNYWKPSYEWTEFCFKKGILDSGIRGWFVHPYGVKLPEAFAEGHDITRGLLKKYGKPDFPMLDTERGFSVAKHQGGGEIANEAWSGAPAEVAHIAQAWHFVRQFMMDQLHGLHLTSWYEFSGDKLGLLPGRPVTKAAHVMYEQLNGYKFVKQRPSDHPQDYVLLWEDRNGGKKIVAWTAPPADAGPEQTQNHSISIDGIAGNVPFVDIAGKSLTASGSPTTFPLTGAPISIPVARDINPKHSQIVPGTMKVAGASRTNHSRLSATF